MFGYMTDLETVEVQKTEEVTAEGEPWARMYARKFGWDPFIVGMLPQSNFQQ